MAGGKEMEIAIKIAGKVESSFNTAMNNAVKNFLKFQLGIKAAAAAANAVKDIGVAAVKTGMEFEKSMSQVAATKLLDLDTADGQAQFQALEDAARQCGATTAFSATEAAESLNNLSMAGYDTDEAIAALPTTLNLAGAGALDLAQSASILTAGMASLGIERTEEEFGHFADILAVTASKAKTDVAGIGEAITTVGKTAAGLKGGTEEVAAALGILADVDLVGAEGGTHLRNMIMSLQNPRNAKAARMFDDLGISAYDSQGKMRGLNEIFTDINASMEGMTDEKKNNVLATIFKQTDVAAASAMLENCGKRFDELYEAAYHSSDGMGAAAEMYQKQMDNLAGDIDILKSSLSDLGISFYKDAGGPLREVTQAASGMVTQLNEAYKSGGLSAMLVEVGDCAALAVNGIAEYAPMIVDVGVGLIQNLISGIAKNSGGIASAAGGIIMSFAEGLLVLIPQIAYLGIDVITQFAWGIASQTPQLTASAGQAIAGFVDGLMQRGPALAEAAMALVQAHVSGISAAAPQVIAAAVLLVSGLASGIIQMLPVLIQSGIQLVVALIQGIGANLGNIVQTAAQLVVSFVVGLIQAVPQVVGGALQIVGALLGAIMNTDWVEVGINIIKSIIEGIASMGGSLLDAIKGLFTFGDDIDISAEGRAAAQSYSDGVNSSVAAAQDASSGLPLFGSMDTSGAMAAGAQAGTAFSTGLTNSMASGGLDAAAFNTNMTNIGTAGAAALNTGLNAGLSKAPVNTGGLLDAAAFNADMTNIGTNGAAALNTGLNTGLSGTPVNTGGILDAAAFNADMTATGTAGATALTTGLNAGLSRTAINTGALSADTSGLTTAMTAAGTAGATAVGTGMAGNSQAVTQAATTLGNSVNTALDSGWNKANANAQAAMQRLAATVTNAARSAAGAVKAAFENMTITVPKPKLPVISVSTSSVSYGDGGNVSVPNFSVSWNALGGIFDRPTIFNTPAGMQGVGEKGPEAILPLDTLWAKMKEILNGATAVSGGDSIIDAFIEKLKGTGTGGNTPEPAGAGGLTVQYSPVYNLYGSAGKDEIAEANRMGQAEFNRLMKQYERNRQRRRL